MDYMDPYCYSNIPGTDVPLDHMDYGYVNSCTDVKELGQILKILRDGKEGHYPELIACTEKRLAELDPRNKLLIKNKPATRMADLPHEESEALNKDLENWTESVNNMTESSEQGQEESSLPPVRKHAVIDQTSNTPDAQTGSSDKKEKRIKSNDFDGWSKFNVEKEAAKVDEEPQLSTSTADKPDIPSQLTEKERGLPEVEKKRLADREKEKGNEAFKAGDFDEAFAYYSRSISFNPSVPAYTNRAFTALKLKRYQDAITDCSKALKIDPANTKALFRRGLAYSQLNKPHQAATDFERVLHFEPNNKKAQQELNIARKKMAEVEAPNNKKKTGRRVQIEEVDKEMSASAESASAESASTESATTESATTESASTESATTESASTESATAESATTKSASTESATTESASKTDTSQAQSEAPLTSTTTPPANATPPQARPAPPPLPSQVQALKDDGNKLFKAGNYSEAVDKYSAAIKILSTKGKSHELNVSMLLNNRAACQLKIGHCQACIADCTQSLVYSVLNVKAFLRRAKAYEHLEKYKQAYNDYQLALSIDRSLLSAYEASSRIIRLLRDLDGNAWRERLPVCPEAARVKQELLTFSTQESSADSAKSTQESSPSLSSADSAQTQGATDETDNDREQPEQSAESADSTSPPVPATEAKTEPSEVTSEPSAVTSKPPIDVISPVSETKVTQSTQSVPSPRTTTTPSPKVKEDLLSPEEKFDKHKTMGNEHMKKGEYVEALRYYDMCVSVNPGNVVGYTNRALCHLKLSSPRKAEEDCDKVLSLELANVKALYRRGLARKALGRHSEAVKDFHVLLTIEPDNASAKRELSEAKQLWEKQLREMQAAAPATVDSKPDRRNPKSKSGKKSKENAQKPPGKDGSQKTPPTKEELEKFQKLLQELEASKEKIEQLSKAAPPGTSWGGSKGGVGGGLGDLPFTGPPRAAQGKVPDGGKKGRVSGGKTPSSMGKSPSKSKKKVPKKPPKVTVTARPKSPQPEKIDVESEVKVESPPASKGKRIVIEEINSSDDESTLPTMADTPTLNVENDQEKGSPPPLRTPFEFAQRWNAIPRTAKSSEYAQLLEAIPPPTLPSVITNKLDDRMLTNIIRAVDKQFIPKGKYELSAEILSSLSQVPRFGMVSMFMGAQEKADLSNVLDALSSSGHVSVETIANIRQQYKV